ncbi:3-phosphoadenosine-5-phosphosulfate reductase [Metschnikowia bicuspidata]|uniref:3-phosphoadenosine-5-phosphosulfate reductase n=1 Tax=Metschnikowia bicuspidata TaxID=27322 RepID=A0A4P9ZHE3_9ASCO|nr:3-phosphoadenosine-5-phosphosulfate reductase [Metschnikowia bicuspidata]
MQPLQPWCSSAKTLVKLSAEELLVCALVTFTGLLQTTDFGLTGLLIIDMMIKKTIPVDMIFIHTLQHFPQTCDLVEKVKVRYSPNLHIYTPQGLTSEKDFAARHGDQLWQTAYIL